MADVITLSNYYFLDRYMRLENPIHIKVKEDDIWEKEDETNKKLRKAIRMIAHKNICIRFYPQLKLSNREKCVKTPFCC